MTNSAWIRRRQDSLSLGLMLSIRRTKALGQISAATGPCKELGRSHGRSLGQASKPSMVTFAVMTPDRQNRSQSLQQRNRGIPRPTVNHDARGDVGAILNPLEAARAPALKSSSAALKKARQHHML